jgi:hypothetical protein
MATSNIISGAFSRGDIPEILLKYDRDKDYAGMIVYLNREIAPLTFLIREKFPRVKVNTYEPSLPEIESHKVLFKVTDNGSQNQLRTTLKFYNDDAKLLQRNDFFSVDGVHFDGVHTWTAKASYAATSGPKEVIRVVEVQNEDSGGSGKTNVVVDRGWGGDGTGSTIPAITTDMKLTLITSSVPEASRSRKSIGKTIATEQNFIQTMREPYEATDFELNEDTFFNERPEQVNAKLAEELLMKKIDLMFWNGRKKKTTDTVSGRPMYTSGGVMEFIPKDAAHNISISKSGATLATMNNACKSIAELGGSEERWLFGGLGFNTIVSNMYANAIAIDQQYLKQFGLAIKTIESSAGIKLNLLQSYSLSQLGYDEEAFVLDLGNGTTPYFQYMYMDDVYINAGPNGKGIQNPDEFIRKEEFVASIGLIRRASQYQAHLYLS